MNFRRLRISTPQINLIPLIDIMLVILIFVLINLNNTQLPALNIHLPQIQKNASHPLLNVIYIRIDAQNHYHLNQETEAFEKPSVLAIRLRKLVDAQKKPPIIIAADQATSYQAILKVIEAARLVGFSQLILTSPPSVISQI